MLKVLGKPLPMPKLPPLSKLGTGPEAERKIQEWSEAVEAVKTVNDALFERDLKRMKRCALLNGFIGRPISEHFAWCPHEAWDSYWKDQGWPGIPQF